MKAIVHLAVGACGALLGLYFAKPAVRLRTEILFIGLLSGWGLVPDFWWFFSNRRPLPAYHYPVIANRWKEFHGSAVANLFWGHRILDHYETGQPVLEAQVAVLVFIIVACLYFLQRATRTPSTRS